MRLIGSTRSLCGRLEIGGATARPWANSPYPWAAAAPGIATDIATRPARSAFLIFHLLQRRRLSQARRGLPPPVAAALPAAATEARCADTLATGSAQAEPCRRRTVPHAREGDDSSRETPATWIEELTRLAEPAQLEAYLSQRPELHDRACVELLAGAVNSEARKDLDRAERLSRAAARLAELAGDDYSLALSLKTGGHVHYLSGRYDQALELYRACQERFFAAGAEVEAAMNLCSSSLQTLSLLGRYTEVSIDLERARAILERRGDRLLLARLTSNEANLLVRQDRHRDAIEKYAAALAELRASGSPQDVAVVLLNTAVAKIAISDFGGALDGYRELSAHCAAHDLPLLAAQADYNIAYLYFFRGEYNRAIEAYQATRKRCEEVGDPYHRALCDLDQAELYLELNREEEGGHLARLALTAFDELGNGYEAAKAVAFLALAARLEGEHGEALRLFANARERFARERNQAWMAMCDLHRASILCDHGRSEEARRLCQAASEHFAGVPWPSRVALCQLLLAKIDLTEGRADRARRRCIAALDDLEGLELPALSLRCHTILGRAEEALGRPAEALSSYRRAHGLVEDLRTHLGSEESMVAFIEDKLEVYESLVWMHMADDSAPLEPATVLGYIEQAKSRILADLIATGGSPLRASAGDDAGLVAQLRQRREELDSCYHELGQLLAAGSSPTSRPGPGATGAAPVDAEAPEPALSRLEALKRRGRHCEDALLEVLNELRSRNSELATLQAADTMDLEAIQASIPDNALLVEYFEARGVMCASLVGRRELHIQPLAAAPELRKNLEMFLGQMAKFGLGDAYLSQFGTFAHQTTLETLRRLHADLIAPLAGRLDAEHLIVVPHSILHQVPFHALVDGDDYLVDRYTFSYAPSASVYAMCHAKRATGRGAPLVLGIPDEQAPEIRAEVEEVAAALPGARLFVGAEATEERLRRLGGDCRLLHIATHGFFRHDNPMFSAIQLGASRLTLFDLYNLELGAELVVLSGCGTGLNVVASGDELIGLTRGLLYAGAPSVVATLWDVHDRSTASFMRAFYERIADQPDRSRALAAAMRAVREEHPSPYYWAPFLLIGKTTAQPADREQSQARPS